MRFAPRFTLSQQGSMPSLSPLTPPSYTSVCLDVGARECTPLGHTCMHTPKQYFQFPLASKTRLTENGLQLPARYSARRCLIKGVELWAPGASSFNPMKEA